MKISKKLLSLILSCVIILASIPLVSLVTLASTTPAFDVTYTFKFDGADAYNFYQETESATGYGPAFTKENATSLFTSDFTTVANPVTKDKNATAVILGDDAEDTTNQVLKFTQVTVKSDAPSGTNKVAHTIGDFASPDSRVFAEGQYLVSGSFDLNHGGWGVWAPVLLFGQDTQYNYMYRMGVRNTSTEGVSHTYRKIELGNDVINGANYGENQLFKGNTAVAGSNVWVHYDFEYDAEGYFWLTATALDGSAANGTDTISATKFKSTDPIPKEYRAFAIGSARNNTYSNHDPFYLDNVTLNFDIVPKEIDKPVADTTVFTYNGSEQTYTVAASEYYTVSNNTRTAAGSQEVTVALKDKERTTWADGTTDDLKFNFNIAKQKVTKPLADATVFTYDGTAKTYTIAENSLYEVSGNTQTNASDDYKVTVSLKDTANYEWADGTTANLSYDFKIGKATPATSFPTGLNIATGQKLSDIDISSYSGYAWDNVDTIVAYGPNNYSMTFTPADTANYKTVTQNVSVYGNDVTAPTGKITVNSNNWDSFLNDITFGLFFKEQQTVTVTSQDSESGVKTTEYYLSETELSKTQAEAITGWTAFADTFKINPNNKYVVYVKITDNAGNVTIINSNGIVLDDIKPVLSGIENGKTYYKEVEVTVADTYLDKVEVNGTPVTVTDGKFKLTASAEKQVIKAVDKAGNVSLDMSVTVEAEHTYVWGEWYDNGTDSHSRDGVCACGADLRITAPKNDTAKGLEAEAEALGKDLELVVEADESKINQDDIKAIKEELEKGISAEYFDISIKDVVGNSNVTETQNVIGISIPFDFDGKSNIVVYHNHGGLVQALEELTAKPENNFEGGTYFLDKENDLIYVYSSEFSTYAVAYHKHSLTNVAKKDATKDADGNIEYWYCEGCDKYFSDKDGKTEIAKSDTVLKYKETENNSQTNNTGNNSQTNNTENKTDVTSPQTGDLSNIWLWVTLFAISGLAVLCILGFNKSKKEI